MRNGNIAIFVISIFQRMLLLAFKPGNPKYIVLMSLTLSMLSKDLKAGHPRPLCKLGEG